MEEKNLTKTLFLNYLRDLYIEMTPAELERAKLNVAKTSNKSWGAIITSSRTMKGLLSYYLVSHNCPEYKLLTTVDLVDYRFSDENKVQDLVYFDGIMIIRHSCTFIRNKLMFETLMYVVSERVYKDKPIIIISDIYKDTGEYTYYDHKQVLRCIAGSSVEPLESPKTSQIIQNTKTPVSSSNTSTFHSNDSSASRPLANIGLQKMSSEQQLKNRTNAIKENVECNIE